MKRDDSKFFIHTSDYGIFPFCSENEKKKRVKLYSKDVPLQYVPSHYLFEAFVGNEIEGVASSYLPRPRIIRFR